MPRVLVVGRETLVIALRSLHVPGMLVHHERPPTDLLSPLPTPALPKQRWIAMCSPQSCGCRSCSKTYYKWHLSPLAALARKVLGGRPVCRHLSPAVLLLPWWQFGMFDYLMPLPVPDGRFWRSVWPPVIFTLLFSVGVSGGLRNIEKLDLVVERVVHREPFTRLHAS
jgi:hypothetical protein